MWQTGWQHHNVLIHNKYRRSAPNVLFEHLHRPDHEGVINANQFDRLRGAPDSSGIAGRLQHQSTPLSTEGLITPAIKSAVCVVLSLN